MFVVLEGIDGCGKSTQAKLLLAALKDRGTDALHLREPGGTRLGDVIRNLILNPDADVEIHSRSEALLYSAARAELVRTVLSPALDQGRSVICERYYYSTLAYQGYGLGEDPGLLHSLSAYAIAKIKPQRVVLLDLAPEVALQRVGKNRDRIESRGEKYMHRVRDGYFLLKRREPERFRVIDASVDQDEVHQRIMEALEDVLP